MKVWNNPFRVNVRLYTHYTFNFKNVSVIQAIQVSHTHENIQLAKSLMTMKYLWKNRQFLHYKTSHGRSSMKHVFAELLPVQNTVCATVYDANDIGKKGFSPKKSMSRAERSELLSEPRRRNRVPSSWVAGNMATEEISEQEIYNPHFKDLASRFFTNESIVGEETDNKLEPV